MQRRIARRRIMQSLVAFAAGPVPLMMHAKSQATIGWLPSPSPIAQLSAPTADDLLAVTAAGELLRWEPGRSAWATLGRGLDPGAPLAVGHGRVAGRAAAGGLWVHQANQVAVSPSIPLSPHGGMVVLALGVIAVVFGERGTGALVRLEPDSSTTGPWREVARASVPVLPDAQPIAVDLARPGTRDAGWGANIAVLAGPDSARYAHAVLGDGIEATRVLYLERHDLSVIRALDLAAPGVFEDLHLRPVTVGASTALLTVQAGPLGAQLVLIGPSPVRGDALSVLASGPPIGTRHRWMNPTTDGTRMAAVHTPHLVGNLTHYVVQGDQLVATPVRAGVSTHAIGSRELGLAAWVDGWLVLPTQDRRRMLVLNAGANYALGRELALPAPVLAVRRVTLGSQRGVVLLLEDGRVGWAGVPAA